jgi:hypothetical protein
MNNQPQAESPAAFHLHPAITGIYPRFIINDATRELKREFLMEKVAYESTNINSGFSIPAVFRGHFYADFS